MSLLFDQNLSNRLPRFLGAIFSDSKHVKDFGHEEKPDESVWDLAREQRLAIVTKDADFVFLSIIQGPPPKVIYLSLGNCSTTAIRDLLLREHAAISAFLAAEGEGLLVF